MGLLSLLSKLKKGDEAEARLLVLVSCFIIAMYECLSDSLQSLHITHVYLLPNKIEGA